jgi:hypothetical protein
MAFLTGQRLTADLLNQNLQGITGNAVADSASITTTETIVLTASLSMTSGQTYGIYLNANISSTTQMAWNVATPTFELAFIRIREDNATGTQMALALQIQPSSSSSGYPVTAYAEYTAVSTASKTIVATLVKGTGSGPWQLRASATRPSTLRVQPLVN